MRDTKFFIQLTVLLSLILASLYVLDFVSVPKKKIKKNKSKEFLIKLSQIENGFDFVEFKKIIKPAKVVVVEKEVIKEVKVPANELQEQLVRDSVNQTIEPAKESFINISSTDIAEQQPKKLDSYKKLELEFQNSHDYKLALKISRLYYTSKRYKDSLKWAMIANEINEKDDSSWILFAKTKLKLGDKKNAKKALLTYDRVYHSKKVKELLGRISS